MFRALRSAARPASVVMVAMALLTAGAALHVNAGRLASRTHARSAAVAACVNCHLRSSNVGTASSNFCLVCGGMDKTPVTWVHMLRAAGLATSPGPFNTWDGVCGPLVADEGWVVLHFIEDPCLQPLEHMEVPHGGHHPVFALFARQHSFLRTRGALCEDIGA